LKEIHLLIFKKTKTMSTQAVSKWAIDANHSEIGFKVKHLMISNVAGKFEKFDGSVESVGDDFTDAKISFTAEVASVNTGQPQRDGHLQSPDFFDAAKFPHIKFTSTKLEKVNSEKYVLTGDLAMHGITKTIKLDVTFSGVAKDSYNNTKAGFEISGKINRTDFGLTFNAPLETGGVVLGEEVKLQIEGQLIKQA
jgi:polyisoprenoid-binding protein YceI